MQPDSGNPVRLLGLLAALALGFGCLLVLRPFLSALLWAAILVYSTWPAFRMLRERLRLSPGLAALVMVLAEFLLIGVPLVFATPTKREEVEGLRSAVRPSSPRASRPRRLARPAADDRPGAAGPLGGWISASPASPT